MTFYTIMKEHDSLSCDLLISKDMFFVSILFYKLPPEVCD